MKKPDQIDKIFIDNLLSLVLFVGVFIALALGVAILIGAQKLIFR
jgi:hypothetical protein